MAVLEVKEDIGSRQHEADDFGVRTYRRRFNVKTDTNYEGSGVVRSATGISQLGDHYVDDQTTDLEAKVVRITPQQQTELNWWKVDVEYSTQALDGRIQVDFHFEPYRIALEHDQFGKPLINSAHEPFDPPVEGERYWQVLTFTKVREASFDRNSAWDHIGTVNSEAWYGYQKRQCRIVDVRARDLGECMEEHEVQVIVKASPIWITKKITIREWKPELNNGAGDYERNPGQTVPTTTWDGLILDRGFHKLRNGNPVVITDDAGRPVSRPQLLDGSGSVLNPNTQETAYNRFRLYREKDFNNFMLLKEF